MWLAESMTWTLTIVVPGRVGRPLIRPVSGSTRGSPSGQLDPGATARRYRLDPAVGVQFDEHLGLRPVRHAGRRHIVQHDQLCVDDYGKAARFGLADGIGHPDGERISAGLGAPSGKDSGTRVELQPGGQRAVARPLAGRVVPGRGERERIKVPDRALGRTISCYLDHRILLVRVAILRDHEEINANITSSVRRKRRRRARKMACPLGGGYGTMSHGLGTRGGVRRLAGAARHPAGGSARRPGRVRVHLRARGPRRRDALA